MRRDKRKAKAGARAPRLDVRMHELELKAGGKLSVPMASVESVGEAGESMGLEGYAEGMHDALEALVADGTFVVARTRDGRRLLLTPEQAAKCAVEIEPMEETLESIREMRPMEPEELAARMLAAVKDGVRSGALVLVKSGGVDGTPLAMPAKDYGGEEELVPMEELDAVDHVSFKVADLVAWGMLAVVRERDGSLGVRLPSDAMEEGIEPIPWTERIAEALARQNGAQA